MGPPLKTRTGYSRFSNVSHLSYRLPAASQAAVQDRGLFGDVIGGILGGDNATVDATTPANADAPSDIVGTLMQVIPLILTSNGTLSHGPDWRSYWHPKGTNRKSFHQACSVRCEPKSFGRIGSGCHYECHRHHRSRDRPWSSLGSSADVLWKHVH